MSARLTHTTGRQAAQVNTPELGRWPSEAFVAEHLGHLIDRRSLEHPDSSSEFRGGQQAADEALAAFDVTGYAVHQDQAYPLPRRSISTLSPYVRHGLLELQQLWDHVDGGPDDDVRAFRGSLLWQEYARHRYARRRPGRTPSPDTGQTTDTKVEGEAKSQPRDVTSLRSTTGRGWDRRMGCVEIALDELEEDGWLVNQARRWLANHWTSSGLEDPSEGEDFFFRHLLDGSRAANRLGWEAAQRYPFTRWEVEERAAGLCASCDLVSSCPIERPRQAVIDEAEAESSFHPSLAADDDVVTTAGPRILVSGDDDRPPEAVWLTAESLGDADPALLAHPDLPAVFVFDEPLLAKLRLSSKRLTFCVETLADLASRRSVEVYLGDPVEVLAGMPLATTFTPVPGWRDRSNRLMVTSLHPWRWLRQPHGGDVTTFEKWRSGLA